jgi:hypothetical protein
MSSDPLAQFTQRIGWSDIAVDGSTADGANRLGRFKRLYERRCSWPAVVYGSRTSREGEEYLAAIRAFAERPEIWHIYERMHTRKDRPTYLVKHTQDGKSWQEIGSFERWPRRWKKPEKNPIAWLFSLYMTLRYRKQRKAIDEMCESFEARARRQDGGGSDSAQTAQ